jgi:O-antigen/teichoic acid export membrane protein
VDWIDFYGFIVGFVLSYLLNILLFTVYLYSRRELSFKPPKSFFRKKLRKVYLNYSFYGILSGSSSVLINKIDAVMIGFIIGLTPTGIYSLSVYLSILIFIPADAIGKISFPLLSRSWKEKRFDQIDELYKKSSLNQFLIGGILFVLLWSNLDNFYSLQKPIYAEGRMALLFLGLARVLNMLFGVNGQIINVSKFYRFDTTTSVLLAILTIVTNLIFIPLYGISGAALATAISIVLFNVVRFVFVYHKLQLQPFSLKTPLAAFLLLIAFAIGQYLPELDSFILDGLYRSLTIGGVFGLLVYFTKVSVDFNHYFDKLIKR